MARIFPLLLVLAAAAYGQGMASRGVKAAGRAAPSGRSWNSRLTNVAPAAGLTASIIYGADVDVLYLSETSSGGVAAFDYDNDGWTDLFLVGGTRFGGDPPEATNRLYRNNRDGTFADVTEKAGLKHTGVGAGNHGRGLQQRRPA